MGQDLERLIFVSEAGLQSQSLSGVSQILADARRRNATCEITGALGIGCGRFLQVVEGRASDLQALSDRLASDPRHSSMMVLERKAVRERLFVSWAMIGPLVGDEVIALIALIDERMIEGDHIALWLAKLAVLAAAPATPTFQ